MRVAFTRALCRRSAKPERLRSFDRGSREPSRVRKYRDGRLSPSALSIAASFLRGAPALVVARKWRGGVVLVRLRFNDVGTRDERNGAGRGEGRHPLLARAVASR